MGVFVDVWIGWSVVVVGSNGSGGSYRRLFSGTFLPDNQGGVAGIYNHALPSTENTTATVEDTKNIISNNEHNIPFDNSIWINLL